VATLNKIIVIGHIGKDAKVGETKAGNPLASFTIATDRSKKVGDQWETTPEWHTVICYGDLAKSAEKVTKGSLVMVEGRIQRNESEEAYDPYFIVASRILVIQYKGDRQAEAPASSPKESFEDLPF
jgi:single-strand DNA-binding protein